MVFEITPKQDKKIAKWMEEQDKKVMEKQKLKNPDQKGVNYGVSGGAYTYCFTPTYIGLVLKVKNDVTDDVIDVTDYESW